VRIRPDHLELVYRIARSIRRRLPRYCELGDLISDGYIGLHQAAERYKRRRGIPFAAYASFRIRGAILDGLRARDCVPRRSARRQVWMLSEARQLDFEPIVEETPKVIGQEIIARAIGQLPTRRERLMMHLYFREGLILREVAGCFGVSDVRISGLIAQSLRRIQADQNENPATDEAAAGS
jgi:RNA polymerase sigma factor (sigma-70 family)